MQRQSTCLNCSRMGMLVCAFSCVDLNIQESTKGRCRPQYIHLSSLYNDAPRMKVWYSYLRSDILYYCHVFLSVTQSTTSGPQVFRIELIILFCPRNVKAPLYPLFLWWTWWAKRQIFRAWTIPVFMGLKSFPRHSTRHGKAPANRVQTGHSVDVIIIICNWGNWGTEQQSSLLNLPRQLQRCRTQSSAFQREHIHKQTCLCCLLYNLLSPGMVRKPRSSFAFFVCTTNPNVQAEMLWVPAYQALCEFPTLFKRSNIVICVLKRMTESQKL